MAQGRRPWRRVAWIAAAVLVVVAALGWRGTQGDRGPIDYSGPVSDWPYWGGDEGGLRYSPLTQITPQNVGRLKVAWTYHVGAFETKSSHPLPAFEATPLLAEGRMYLCTNTNKVIALDPETGREILTFDPKIDSTELFLQNCRGVTFHHDEAAAAAEPCASRIITGTRCRSSRPGSGWNFLYRRQHRPIQGGDAEPRQSGQQRGQCRADDRL